MIVLLFRWIARQIIVTVRPACLIEDAIAFFIRWYLHALVGMLINVLLVPFRFCWAQTNLEVGVLPTAAMKVAKDLEKIRKIRRRLAKNKPMIMMPTNDETPDIKLIGTMGLQFNSDAMLVMAKYFGIRKRATIPFLEKEVPHQYILYMHHEHLLPRELLYSWL